MADFSRHQPPAHLFRPYSYDPLETRRRDGLTFGRNWNSEVLARLEAKQLLAEVVLRHGGRKDRVQLGDDLLGPSLRCFCGDIWTPTAIDPLNKRCPMIVGAEANCWDAGCTRAEIEAVWDGFRWAK